MTRERTFPPGVGWWQAALAGAIVLLVAAVAAAPRFQTKVVGTAQGVEPGSTVQQSNAPGTKIPGASTAPGTGPAGKNGGSTVTGPQVSAGPAGGAIDCAHGKNGGSTAPGVSGNEIHVASTVVTSGVGQDFLGEAALGVKAAFEAVNQAGGVCGRRLTFETVNSGWDGPTGKNYIDGFIHSGRVFALVGQPDSQGLDEAINSGTIDGNRMPAVGTDGMLKSQYHSEWVWPVAASTVTNMHVAADYGVDDMKGKSFGIVYDSKYRFGPEGAKAFAEQVRRRGYDVKGYSKNANGCSQAFCGISSDKQSYSTEIQTFNNACKPCDVVVMLLEPGPMIAWMNGERSNQNPWYKTLIGGEPLFDDGLGQQCPGCGKAKLVVWTGYRAAIQPFDAEKPVYTYCQRLHAQSKSADCHNAFTEGAYLGAQMFIEAARRVGDLGLPLTRENLKTVLDANAYSLGLTDKPVAYRGLPHIANSCMTAFSDNYSGSFNGWSYLQAIGWKCDPNPALEL
jgi:ABC-type branched-subunit amino acid transport system substrate-binding protein